MTIRREDLAAAAALGLLKYRQIDPLLVYLLQRDVHAQRQELAAQIHAPRHSWAYGLLSTLAAVLAVATVTMFGLVFYTRMAPAGSGVLLAFSVMYMLMALGAVRWLGRRVQGGTTRTLSALAVATVPLVVLTLAQFA